jgi:copper chaperone
MSNNRSSEEIKVTQVELQVPEVHCDHCKHSLEGAVGALAGVDTVEVHVADAKIDVSYNDTVVALDVIKKTIEAQGYAVFG